MHAVVVRVSFKDVERAQEALKSEVVPRVSGAPGFQGGYWTRSTEGEANGLSIVLFDSEENARAAAERVRGLVPETISLESVEVREVVASAIPEAVATA